MADNFGKAAIKKIMVASSPVVWPVTVQFLAMIAKALELEGVSREDFLADSGLSPALLDAGEHYIPYTTTLQLLERARDLSHDPCFGMTLGKLQTPSGWGVLGYAINCCSTIGQALQVAMKYHRIATNITGLRLECQGDTASWVAEPPVPLGRLLPMVMEQEFLAFCRSVPVLTGKSLPLQAAWFSYPAPAHAERYQQELGCPVHFDAADNRLAFDSAFLDCPMLQANPLTIAMAVRLCDQLMNAHPASDPLTAQVRELLCANLSGFLDEEAVAARFNVTSRTLRNRLNRAGSSFQRILNDVRAQLGKDLLSHTPIKIDDIAVRLGFSTARSFRRAFRHWTGQSPAEFRKSAASQGQLADRSMAGGA